MLTYRGMWHLGRFSAHAACRCAASLTRASEVLSTPKAIKWLKGCNGKEAGIQKTFRFEDRLLWRYSTLNLACSSTKMEAKYYAEG